MYSRVKLLAYTPNPEKICDTSARLSQTDKTGSEILNTNYDKYVIDKVMNLGHHSVAEHAHFNFSFENVSVFVEHFLIEFRLASFTVKSRRYVDFRNAGHIKPDYLKNSDFLHLENDFTNMVNSCFETYGKLVDMEIPQEDARFILPYCFHSNFILTMNARELIHVLHSMIHGRGKKYPEIKKVGLEMHKQLKEVCPSIFSNDISKGKEDKWHLVHEILTEVSDENHNKDKVEIIYKTDNAEKVICDSLCAVFGKNSNNITQNQKESIINAIISDRRARELELANYVFVFRGISYPFLTHFIRHRIHSPLISPFEYTDYKNFIVPDTIKNNINALNIFNNAIKINKDYNDKIISLGVPVEDMIYSRVAGCVLNVTTNMNCRELLHFLALRTCERAQWEIREYADDLLFKLKKISPLLFKKAGPGCVFYGKCPEGKMTCGKQKEKLEKYLK